MLAGVLAGAAMLVAVRWWRVDRALSTSLAALAMLVASPVAWSHHWVWAVPLVLAVWPRSRLVAAAVAAVFAARPFLWLPHEEGRELGWSPPEHVVGNAYLLCAVALVVWAAHAARDTRTAAPGITLGGQSQESSQGR